MMTCQGTSRSVCILGVHLKSISLLFRQRSGRPFVPPSDSFSLGDTLTEPEILPHTNSMICLWASVILSMFVRAMSNNIIIKSGVDNASTQIVPPNSVYIFTTLWLNCGGRNRHVFEIIICILVSSVHSIVNIEENM